MGDIYNQIQYTYGQPINILGKYGCQINYGAGSSMLIGSNTLCRVSILQGIVMNNHYLANLHDPNSPQDAATKIM